MILDDKGRIFGKINIIDLVAIIVVIVTVAGLLTKITTNITTNQANLDTKNVYIKVRVAGVLPQIAKSLQKGDRLINNSREIDAWVINVQVADNMQTTTTSTGELTQQISPEKKDLIITIKAKVPKDTKLPYTVIGVQKANIGNPFSIMTFNTYLNGKVVDFKG